MSVRRGPLILALVALLVLVLCVFDTYLISTSSMSPTANPGDVVIANHWVYSINTKSLLPIARQFLPSETIIRWRSPQRNDVVCFAYPGMRDQVTPESNEVWLKRVVACAGDTIHIVEGRVFVNNILVRTINASSLTVADMQYFTFPKGALYSLQNYGPLRVPAKGDTLPLTQRQEWGAWKVFMEREGHSVNEYKSEIDGKRSTFYVVERDYAFVMGDNAENSVDSRTLGPIAYDAIFASMVVSMPLPNFLASAN